jgi:hypothetical protein
VHSVDGIYILPEEFKHVSALTGKTFDIGVFNTLESISTDWCPSSEMYDLSLQGKHVWLNASTHSELRNQLLYFQSEYEASHVNTSGCILLPLRCYFRSALSKGWRELMSIPKGSMVHRRMSDESLSLERSTMPLQVLYLAPAANEMLPTMAGSSAFHSVVAASLKNSDKSLKMLFAGQAAGARANILFDSGATQNFVSGLLLVRLVFLSTLLSGLLNLAQIRKW